MALISHLKNKFSLSQYFMQIDMLNDWFKSCFLELNVSRTKELIFGSRNDNNTNRCMQIELNGQKVEVVDSFKYLGTVVDQKLTFTQHVDFVFKKAQQRLFLLRKLKHFSVSQGILYRSLIESILAFNIVTWFGVLTVRNKASLSRIVNTASKVIGCSKIPLSDVYAKAIKRKASQIIADSAHPLHPLIRRLSSGRHFRVPLARTTATRNHLFQVP